MSFLSEDYKQPASGGNYLKFKKGINKIRILSDSITGRVDREDKSPVRTKEKQPALDPTNKPKHFRAFVIWDYEDKCIKVAEVTQKSIQDAIFALYNDEDRGDPKGYDIKITKEGEGMDTKYTVNPSPKKELDKEILQLHSDTLIDLNNLFTGQDPFDVSTAKSIENDDVPF